MSTISAWSARVPVGRVWKLGGAGIAGLGIGTALSGGAIAVPGLGAVPSLLVGGLALITGGVLFKTAAGKGCGCGSDCSC